MVVDIVSLEKVPVMELNFLKKVKKTRLLATAFSIVLTLVFSYLLYASEYHYTNYKGDLSMAKVTYRAFFCKMRLRYLV